MRNYRSRLDIIANILDVVNENPKKTQIMIQANLSFKLLQKYLAEIVNAQLVSFEDEKRLFKLEDKGRHFLKCYKNYSKTYRSAEKRLDEVAAQKKVLEELCSSSFSLGKLSINNQSSTDATLSTSKRKPIHQNNPNF